MMQTNECKRQGVASIVRGTKGESFRTHSLSSTDFHHTGVRHFVSFNANLDAYKKNIPAGK